MKKLLSFFMLLLLMAPAFAQSVEIDEITVNGEDLMVNKECLTVRFKVNNNTGIDMAADEYALCVLVGDVVAGQPAALKAIPNGTYETFTVYATPHQAGENLPVTIKMEGWGSTEAVAETTVTVAAEVPSGEVQIGSVNTHWDVDYYVPLNTYYDYSQTEVIYTAEDLGLANGTVLTGLTLKGKKDSDRSCPVTVWIEQTEDVAPASTNSMTMYSTDNMIRVYNDTYQFKTCGQNYENEPVFSIEFPSPIVYEGKSLRIIFQTEKAASTVKTEVEIDKTRTGRVATRYADGSMDKCEAKAFKTDSYGTPYYQPVLYLGVEKEASTVSGTVCIIKKGTHEPAPLANAQVVLKHDNVLYFAQTDAQGQYCASVCQDKQRYYVEVSSDECVLFPNLDVIDMKGVSETLDLQVAEAYGSYILNEEIPYFATVNNAITIKADVMNYEAYDLTPANSTIQLIQFEVGAFDDVDSYIVLSKLEDYEIEAGDCETIELTCTPHAAGSVMLGIQVLIDDLEDDVVSASEVFIDPEKAVADIEMAEDLATANETTAPIRLYSTHSYTQTVITADMLGNLPAGSKITGLKFQSAQSTNSKNFLFDAKAWIMNTTDDIDAEAIDPHSADLQQVFEGTLQQRAHGSYNDGATTYEEFLVINFDEPFVYTGQNLRIAMRADIQGSGYQQTYFKAVKDVRGTFTKSSDNPKIDGVAVDIMDYTWGASKSLTPVVTFVVDMANVVTGEVVDAKTNEPIEAATVKMVAADEDVDVLYTATTDEAGAFEMNVIQNGYDYVVCVEADGYEPATVNVEANFSSMTIPTIKLTLMSTTAISNVNAAQEAKAFDLMGRQLRGNAHGLFIQNGIKVIK